MDTLFPIPHHPLMAFPLWLLPGGEAGGYKLYGPALSADAIDYAADPVAHVAPGVSSAEIADLSLTADTDWWFAIRAVSSAGVEEANTAEIVRVRISAGALVDPPPNTPIWAAVEAAAGGKVTIRATYSARGEGSTATGLQVARVVGGAADWGALLTTISIGGTGTYAATPGSVFADGEDVRLAIRAVTAGGVTGGHILTNTISADTTAPASTQRLTGSQYA